jgi:outer membrane protein assembly factor BamB
MSFRTLPRLALLPVLLAASVGVADDPPAAGPPAAAWSQFLGPERNGLSPETNLLDTWPEGGPTVLWRVPLGTGMSGIAVDGGRVVTLAHREGRQAVVALDPANGRPLVEIPVAPIYRNAMGNGPRATPTLVGDAAFVYTGEGVLAKVDLARGEVLWSRDVPTLLGGEPAEYGMASSPLVVGRNVIVVAGAPGATVAAFETTSGDLAWKAGDDPAGYSSPALLEVGGRSQVVVFAGDAVLGLDPANGTVHWRHPYKTAYHCNTATPIAVAGDVFVSAGENHGSVRLDVSGGEPAVVWESQGPRSVLRSEWQTPLLLGGHLYGFDNVGSAGAISHLTCIDASTGERVWQQPRFGKGNLVAADGKLFLSTFDGELVVARATAKGYEELGRTRVLGRTRQAPALANGRLYLRDDRELVCLDTSAPADTPPGR